MSEKHNERAEYGRKIRPSSSEEGTRRQRDRAKQQQERICKGTERGERERGREGPPRRRLRRSDQRSLLAFGAQNIPSIILAKRLARLPILTLDGGGLLLSAARAGGRVHKHGMQPTRQCYQGTISRGGALLSYLSRAPSTPSPAAAARIMLRPPRRPRQPPFHQFHLLLRFRKVNFLLSLGEESSSALAAVYRPNSLKRSNQTAPKKPVWRDARQKRTLTSRFGQMKEMPLANQYGCCWVMLQSLFSLRYMVDCKRMSNKFFTT